MSIAILEILILRSGPGAIAACYPENCYDKRSYLIHSIIINNVTNISFQYDDPMGHYSGMSEMSGSTSGNSGIYGGDMNRSLPQVPHLNHGPSLTHFAGSDTPSLPIHNTQSSSGSRIDDRISEADQLGLKRDKDTIYS